MTDLTRRGALALGGVAASVVMPALAYSAVDLPDQIAADLERYIGFGLKHAGGPGDTACAAWMKAELEGAGFAVERHTVRVPWLELDRAQLHIEGETINVLPLHGAPLTSPDGVEAPLVRFAPTRPERVAGAIALIELPYGRWSTVFAAAIREPLQLAFAAGAAGAVLVTHGPTGDAIQLNVEPGGGLASGPVVILAPDRAQAVLRQAEVQGLVRLVLSGRQGERTADNLAGLMRRGTGRWLVVSTPRSGWTACAGERGPGIAAFLALARDAAARFAGHDLLFLCTTGHEYENHGAMEAIEAIAPSPEATGFWFHLGAGFAARDWHEAGALGLLPLPSADPQRYLLVTDGHLAQARQSFAGLAGLEMVYPVSAGAAGELGEIARAGYTRCAGMFGAHRYHHVEADDARCVDAALVRPVIEALRHFLHHIVR